MSAVYTNLLNIYNDATSEEIRTGKAWYNDARVAIAALADEVGIDTYTFAAVVAALSPRIRWATNLDAAARMCRAAVNDEPMPIVAGFGHNRRIAWNIANGASFDLLTGPKTRAFFGNLTDNESMVTVDIWMYRAAGLKMDNIGNRASVMSAIWAIAINENITPAQVQAIIWTVVRDRWND